MPHVLVQISSCCRSLWRGRWFFMSAKRRTVDFTESGRSLIWNKKKRGPSTVPWGTPESSLTASDSSPQPSYACSSGNHTATHLCCHQLHAVSSFGWASGGKRYRRQSSITISTWVPKGIYPPPSPTPVMYTTDRSKAVVLMLFLFCAAQ